MPVQNRRKGGRARRNDELKFAYSGPFAPLLDPIRTLPVTAERYAAASAESYTIGSRIPEETRARLVEFFTTGRAPKRRRGRRGGGRRVAA